MSTRKNKRNARRSRQRRRQWLENELKKGDAFTFMHDPVIARGIQAMRERESLFASEIASGSRKRKRGKRIGDNALTATNRLRGTNFGGRYAWDTRYFKTFPDVNERPFGHKRPKPKTVKWLKKDDVKVYQDTERAEQFAGIEASMKRLEAVSKAGQLDYSEID